MKQQIFTLTDYKKKFPEKEKNIQWQILQYLTKKGYWVTLIRNLAVYDEKIKARRKNPYMRKGLPDILCFAPVKNSKTKDYMAIAIECKRPGKGLEPAQEEFARYWWASGNMHITAHSLRDVISAGL